MAGITQRRKLLLHSSFLPNFMDFAQPRVDFCFMTAYVGIIDINFFVSYRNTNKYEHNRNNNVYPIPFKTNNDYCSLLIFIEVSNV